MKEYKNYTIEICLKSPTVTSFQSDTIFGHICWAIRFLYDNGENKLHKFLKTYDNTGGPPLLLSNGFPFGYLPKPIIPPVRQQELEDIIKIHSMDTDRIKNSFKIKTIKKLPLIPKNDFDKLQLGTITPSRLFKSMAESYETIMKDLSNEQSVVVQHNTVNRVEGKVKTGLYSQEETFYSPDAGKFVIYLNTYYFSKEELAQIFTFIKEQGFGKDKSTGKGHFGFEIKEEFDLRDAEKSNAFMTLSSYIPKEKDPSKGYYHTLLKYGKLGGLYANGSSEVNNNPFKKPLIMFSAGSVFYDNEYNKGKNYGSLIRDIHHNENIRHYAYAFPVGINLEDTYEDI